LYFLLFQGDPKDVIELTDSNFDSLVLTSEDMWLVEFYAPWCGHCKNLAPHWAQAATELKGKVRGKSDPLRRLYSLNIQEVATQNETWKLIIMFMKI
jgi:thiol-disulfide isomerase/thioredoxin